MWNAAVLRYTVLVKATHTTADRRPSLRQLFVSFLRLGATAFGGPARVAHIRDLAVERNEWLDEAIFRDGVAICQLLPGATAMQTAAYVGLRSRGLPGATVCFLGFGLPAFCCMAVLSALYVRTHDLPLAPATFEGLRAMTVAIVAHATLTFGKRSLKRLADITVAALAATLFAAKVNPIAVIVVAALLSLVLYRGQFHTQASTTDVSLLQVCSPRQVTSLVLMVAVGYALLFVTNRGLFELGVLMFRIDLFAFGGGFASIPLMFYEIVDGRAWLDGATLMHGIALGQVTPGPIVITATFVGYLLHGVTGAVVATAGIFLPSFLLVVGVVPLFDRLRRSAYFNRCMSGILASFVGLLLSVTIQFGLGVPWNVPRILVAGGAFVALLIGTDLLWVVLAGIAVSMLIL